LAFSTSSPAKSSSTWDPLHLLDGVGEVAVLVDPIDITSVSQRGFDDARSACAGFEALPAARNISERLGLSWTRVLELAELPREGRTIGLGRLRGEREEQDWLTPGGVEFALRLVARRLGLRTLTPGAYDAERDRMLRENRRRWRHGGHLLLPNSAQVITLMDSWERALACARLAPRQAAGGNRRRSSARPIIEVIECCYEHYEVQPGYRQLHVFARANGISVQSHETGKRWAAYIEEWKAARRERGLPEPNGPAPRGEAPDFSVDVGAGNPGERRQQYDRTIEDCVEWVVRYLQERASEESPSSRRYDQWARQQDGAPWSSEFTRSHGGWVRVRDLAWRKVREGG
jgi:hypothetical protein